MLAQKLLRKLLIEGLKKVSSKVGKETLLLLRFQLLFCQLAQSVKRRMRGGTKKKLTERWRYEYQASACKSHLLPTVART